MTDIIMPKLSDTMTEGVFGKWRKGVGERISRGDIIAEVETDKATMELEAFASGTLLEQRVRNGAVVGVGTVIGVIGEPGEQPEEAKPAQPSPSILEEPEPVQPPRQEQPAPQKEPEAAPTPAEAAPAGGGQEVKAAPVVRRLAREMGVDLERVAGSGPGGRILVKDVEQASRVPSQEAGTANAGAAQGVEAGEPEPARDERQEISRMRGAIARTVAESWRTIPHFTVTCDLDMGMAEKTRTELKDAGIPVSLNDLIIKAAAMALVKYPMMNASYREDGIVLHKEVNIAVMIELPDGLVAPVIRGCQALPLRELAAGSRRLIDRARSGALTQADLAGGTFAISNMGMYGVSQFTAIILPPQAAILAVGAVTDAVAMANGQPIAVRQMKATISADHRVVDGAYAARFMKELREIMASPVQLLL